MSRLRVCQLITSLEPAGAERCVYELAKRLDGDRFDVQVLALQGGAVADWLAEAGVKVTVLDVRGKWHVSKLAALTRTLRRERIDLLHTHLFHAGVAGRAAAYLADVPHVIHTIHVAEGRFRPWRFAYARLLANSYDRLVCVSRSVRDFHANRSGLPLWRYTVIANGIDTSAFRRDAQSRRRLRGEGGIADGAVLVAFVGRLDYQKGVDTLLAAASHLGARGSPMNLVIAGDGPKRRLVENFIKHGEGGRYCRLLGFISDVRAVLSAADIAAMPSRWEGWPLSLGEAMACGLAVVAAPVAGIGDVLVDGVNGLMVERGSPVALADAIERLARDGELRERLGQAARRDVADKHSIDANIAAHEALYGEIAADILQG